MNSIFLPSENIWIQVKQKVKFSDLTLQHV